MADMFNFAEVTADMKPAEILNYYRNLYYAEPQVTERGILANAINEILPNMVGVVRCKDCKEFYECMDGTCFCCHLNGLGGDITGDSFCSYGERKAGNEKGAVNGSEEVPGENQEN